MSGLIKLFLSILMIYLINSSEFELVDDIKENSLTLVNLGSSTIQAIFKIKSGSKKMLVDLIFSHPSNYNFTLNQYDPDVDDEDIENLNPVESEQEPLLFTQVQNVEIDRKFINSKRRLESIYTENQTDLIESEESLLGRNRLILNLEEEMSNIVLTLFRKEDVEENKNEKIYVRYRNYKSEKVETTKVSIDNTINVGQMKDMLDVEFGGLILGEDVNVDNYTVKYNIQIFNEDDIKSKYENYYIYSYTNDIKPLFSTSFSSRGNAVKKSNYIRIKASLNERNSQYLLINAKVKNLDDEEEQLLQYKVFQFTVEEESGERKWPDEKEKEKKESEKSGKTDEEKIKEENEIKLYIILACFILSVVLTFVGLFIYLAFFGKKDNNIEEDTDYKDVGGIVEDKKEDDGKKINEEEE